MEERNMENARLHGIVLGRVQGVGFRAFVEQAAGVMGLTGWVRNRWDGSVEVLAEGPRQVLEQFAQALKSGPRMSNVETLIPTWGEATGEFSSFSVRRTE
jgi:acylphosphatase